MATMQSELSVAGVAAPSSTQDQPLQTSFRAMGCQTHVVIHGGRPEMLEFAERRIRELESLWSRFLDTSDITVANRTPGRPVRVDEDTLAVVCRAIAGWRQTGGLFDITMLPSLLAHGYTHSAATSLPAPPIIGNRVGVCGAIEVDFEESTLTVPERAAIDLGGIGKGFAADIVAEDLIADGALGVIVNIGGDLVALGEPAPGQSWYLGIEDPTDRPNHLACVRIRAGGLATSGTTIRTWVGSSGEAEHHLIDPSTSKPSRAGLSTVTVIAGDAATAEVFATAAMMLDGPHAMAMLERNGLAGIAVGDDGSVHRSSTLAQFEN
jgi:thiamine biosynthesis lipoprotein